MHKKIHQSAVIISIFILGRLFFLADAFAQSPPSYKNQSFHTQPMLPSLELPALDSDTILPVIPLPQTSDLRGLLAGQKVFVNEYRVKGNSILTDDVLFSLTQPYVKREVSLDDLAQLRDDLSYAYISLGYINSGAVIPPQAMKDGVLEINIIEGRLIDIEYQTDGRLHESYVTRRLHQGASNPLNVYQLEQHLQKLQQNDLIQNIQAVLTPTDKRGESILNLQLFEEKPLQLAMYMDNYESPSVGAETMRLHVGHTNLSGYGDRLDANFDGSKGMRSATVHYQVPLNAKDILLDLHAKHSESDVIEAPFDLLNIESESSTYGISLTHPFIDSMHQSSSISLTAEVRLSKSFLLGQPNEFTLGAEEGKSKVAVLRIGMDWFQRDRKQAFAGRSLLSVGLDALDSTTHPGDLPDSKFVALLLQGQWAHRLPIWNAQISARGDIQYSNTSLLGLEQFAIGGHATVRGYRENTLVRDQGWVMSVEGRIPVWRRQASQLEVGVFIDKGRAWNKQALNDEQTKLLSAGIITQFVVNKNISLQLDWAKPLEDISSSTEDDLQDKGGHFRVSIVN